MHETNGMNHHPVQESSRHAQAYNTSMAATRGSGHAVSDGSPRRHLLASQRTVTVVVDGSVDEAHHKHAAPLAPRGSSL